MCEMSDLVRIFPGVTSAVGSEVAVAGPFVACVRVGEEDVRGCLSDLSLDLLRACRPVRVPGVYRRQRHMPGRWFSTTAGCFLEYESLLERDWMLLMDFDRQVEWICEQPLRLRYGKDGEPVSHVPDLLVWRGGVAVLHREALCRVPSASRPQRQSLRRLQLAGLFVGSPLGGIAAAGSRRRPGRRSRRRSRVPRQTSCRSARCQCGVQDRGW